MPDQDKVLIEPSLLNKIQRLATALDDEGLTRQEFADAFQKVVDLVLKIETKQNQAIEALRVAVQQTLKTVEDQTCVSLEGLEKKVDGLFISDKWENMKEEMHTLVNEKLHEMDTHITKVKDGKLGAKGEQGLMGLKGEPGRPPTAEEIEFAMKPTVEEFRKSWEEKVQSALASRGRGVGGGRQLRMTSFSFSGDGSTTSFSLSTQPGAKGNAIFAFLNGQQIQKGTHFTIGRKTLDTTFTPADGDTIEGYLINE